jgi:NADH-quinone oxidoreductase subunit C/D
MRPNVAPIPVQDDFARQFADADLRRQPTRDEIPTYWISRSRIRDALGYLRTKETFKVLYDLTCIDERDSLTLVYHLLSYEKNRDIRLKVSIGQESPSMDTVTDLWPAADWYEREVWDLFGVHFSGHPNLERILLPKTWKGHPLRKAHPARATEMGGFELSEEKEEIEQESLRFNPERWGMKRSNDGTDFMFLNLGPHHLGTHGVFRIALQLDGEEIIDGIPEIGFHHRGAEKMGERQTWHTYIPYTDRIDYLAGVVNNFPYVLAVEKLAGIMVPARAQTIRVMMAELFRIASHLVWYGTFAQDLGALSPVFYMFTDRERIFEIVEAFCGARMHPGWFRIGGVAQDLPQGWDGKISEFLRYMPARLDEYDRMVMKNRLFKVRTQGIGAYTREEAIDWGVTGPGLRACGMEWDFRKKRPYSGYENFDFEIPTASNGDCYARAEVRVEEMRQSLRIIEQCLKQMPSGPYQANHPAAVPPRKERTMHDIETLITHFLGVSWGPVIPAGEAHMGIEATKGNNGYYLVSDGNTKPYRVRIRTPSFPHLQMLRHLIGERGGRHGVMIPDLMAILGSMDYVLADVDR